MCEQAAGININFSWEDIKVKLKNLVILENISRYILDLERQNIKRGKIGVEERWILSRYHSTLKRVSELFETYQMDETIREIENLYLSLSRDYIKLVREKSGDNGVVVEIVKGVYLGVLKMFSTVCPFITEFLWREMMQKEESVHLSTWENIEKDKIDVKLEKEFEDMFKVIEEGLAVRDKEGIGLRWPLNHAKISGDVKLDKEILEIIKRQLNVKNVVFENSEKEVRVGLDLKITEELEGEGYARELARIIQTLRKKAGLKKGDLIDLTIGADSEMSEKPKRHSRFLHERTNSKRISFVDGKLVKSGSVFTIKEKQFSLKLS
jgi:valyl-tRNA synthetase